MKQVEYVLGTAIKEIRLEKGLSGKHVAKELGITPSTLSKYESNDRKLKAETLPAIARVLGVTIEHIYAKKVGDTPILKTS